MMHSFSPGNPIHKDEIGFYLFSPDAECRRFPANFGPASSSHKDALLVNLLLCYEKDCSICRKFLLLILFDDDSAQQKPLKQDRKASNVVTIEPPAHSGYVCTVQNVQGVVDTRPKFNSPRVVCLAFQELFFVQCRQTLNISSSATRQNRGVDKDNQESCPKWPQLTRRRSQSGDGDRAETPGRPRRDPQPSRSTEQKSARPLPSFKSWVMADNLPDLTKTTLEADEANENVSLCWDQRRKLVKRRTTCDSQPSATPCTRA